MWNYVQLDGLWYGIDTTWDDSTASNQYFLKGSESFSLNHTPESVYPDVTLTFPMLSEQDYGASAITTTATTETTTTITTTTIESETTTTTESTVTTNTTTTETTITTITEPMTTTTTSTNTTTTEMTTTITTETVITTSTTEKTYPIGDCNQDGVCTLIDYVLLRKYLIRVVGVTGTPEMDVNADDRVDILDAIIWARQFL